VGRDEREAARVVGVEAVGVSELLHVVATVDRDPPVDAVGDQLVDRVPDGGAPGALAANAREGRAPGAIRDHL
jgi:hypothetical protein